MWDVDSGKELHRFSGHTGRIHQLSLNRDANRFVSSSADGSAKVWDLSAVTDKLDGTPLDHPSSAPFHPSCSVVMSSHALVYGGKSFAFDLKIHTRPPLHLIVLMHTKRRDSKNRTYSLRNFS